MSAYPLFTPLYTALVGSSPADFKFQDGVTPLSTTNEVIITCITYFLVIFGGQHLMTSHQPFKLSLLSKIHNLLLTVGSGLLLVLFAENILPMVMEHGLFYAICDTRAWTQPLELLYYINYLFKYYELIDTVFLVLKKKKLDFLHYYHHSMTLVLCFTQLQGHTSVSWTIIMLNLLVHVIMYYYYLLTCFGLRVWWKQYLTTLQIVQFVIDLGFVYYCAYTYFTATYWPWMPNHGTCAGTETAAFFGVVSLSSYLLLFVQFFFVTYNKKVEKKE
jgi:hypothetical protein